MILAWASPFNFVTVEQRTCTRHGLTAMLVRACLAVTVSSSQ